MPENGIMFSLVWLSLTYPLLFTNDSNNSGYYNHQKKPLKIAEIFRPGYTLKMEIPQSTSQRFSSATQNNFKSSTEIFQEEWVE